MKLRATMRIALGLAFLLGLAVISSVAAEKARKDQMQLTSTAFAEGAAIPAKHTCDAKNVSPPLKWSGAPAGTKSLALIVDDPDAPVGTWVHWVLYNLPATTTELAEDLPKSQFVAGGAKQGLNDFRHLGYGGPCPPHGKPHRYFFKLYALDVPLDLKPGLTKKDLEHAMEKHILAQAQLMGTYQRK
jgi:Raf kinase inhibitor-like YbhB/YbcL family protein